MVCVKVAQPQNVGITLQSALQSSINVDKIANTVRVRD